MRNLSGGLDRATLVVAGVAILGLVMAVLDTTIVNVALDTLSNDLHAPLGTIQWVSTGYLLSLATVLPLSGWVTERFGSKRTWIAAIAVFAIGSALCALATSAAELIVFRVLQGVGGGLLVPVGFTLVAQSAGPRRIGRALALMGVPILLAPIFGPIIGGLIVDSAPWQWIFVVNVPIAVVAILVAVRLLQADAGRADPGPFDWLGAALLCPGLAGVVFGLSETESQGGIGHPISLRADRRRARSGRALRLAQPARTAAADRGAPVPLTRLPRRRHRHVLSRGSPVRDVAGAPALLPGRPRRERVDGRPANRPARARRRCDAADQRPSDGPHRRRTGDGRRLLPGCPGDAAVGVRDRRHAVRRCSASCCSCAAWASAHRSSPARRQRTRCWSRRRCRAPQPHSTRCGRSEPRSARPSSPWCSSTRAPPPSRPPAAPADGCSTGCRRSSAHG